MIRTVRRCGALALVATAAALSVSPPAAASDLAAIRSAGVLPVGTSGDYAPFSVAHGDGFSGFDVDLMNRLAKDLGVRLRWVRFRWPDLTGDLASGAFEVATGGVTVRAERALAGRFTRPYAVTGAMVLVRAEDRDRFKDVAALDRAGVRVVVNQGGHLARVAAGLFPHAVIEGVADNGTIPERLLLGTTDAAVTDSAELRAWQRPELSALGPFTRDRKAMLVRRDSPELVEWIDDWLRQRERDGWLPRLRKKWFDDAMFFAGAADRQAVLADVELRCRLMPAVAASKRAAGLPIEDPEQEQRVLERVHEVARAAGVEPTSAQRLFRSLILAAKAIQAASGADPSAFAPGLDRLRETLTEIDEHLIRQLRSASATVQRAEWQAGVREGVNVDGLNDALKADLAVALARVRRQAAVTPAARRTPYRAEPRAQITEPR